MIEPLDHLTAFRSRRPNVVYRESGWESWGDWLGTGAVSTRSRGYRSFTRRPGSGSMISEVIWGRNSFGISAMFVARYSTP